MVRVVWRLAYLPSSHDSAAHHRILESLDHKQHIRTWYIICLAYSMLSDCSAYRPVELIDGHLLDRSKYFVRTAFYGCGLRKRSLSLWVPVI